MSFNKDSLKEMNRSKRRTKRLYKFFINKISKVEPLGNRRRGTKIPEPRSGHRIVIYDGNLYAFGGFNPNIQENESVDEGHEVLFKELWRFNFAARNWTKLNTSGKMPDQLASHAAVLLNNCMLVYGGTGVPFGESSSNCTHICNLDTLEWETLSTTGYIPLEQYGQAISVSNGKMYAVGGTTGYTYSMSVHSLNLSTKEWKLVGRDSNEGLPNEPEPRYRHEIAIYDNQIFVFGGGTVSQTYGFKEIPVLNLTECSWRMCPTSAEYPAARKCHGCVQNGSDVYICGGHDGAFIFSDVWKFCLRTLRWEKLKTKLPTAVYFHSAAISHAGQIFIFGGVADMNENTRTNELFSMWIKLPSLAEICWQAVLSYIPHIALMDKKKLIQAGIPVRYINQIEFAKCNKVETIAANCCPHSKYK